MFQDLAMVLLFGRGDLWARGVWLGRRMGWVWEEGILVGGRRFGWDGVSFQAWL